MATTETEQLRGLTNGAVGLTDIELQDLLTAKGSMNAAARYIWQTKAAATADLSDVSESGSTRALSQLHKQALSMSDVFVDPAEVTEAATSRKTTRRAVRR